MGLIDVTAKLEVPAEIAGHEGEWVEVKQLSIADIRKTKSDASADAGLPSEEKDEAFGFAVSIAMLEAAVVAWSDDAPVNPENIAKLPYKVATWVANRIVGVEDEAASKNA